MNTTAKGDAFEAAVLGWAKRHVREHGGLHLHAPDFTVEAKRAIYSPDRERDIVFDVVLEALHDGMPSRNLVVFECKHLSRPVEVGEVEEFFGKVQQLRGYHVKPILATRTGVQEAALNYARSKGVGVVRLHKEGETEWVLRSHPDVRWRAEREDRIVLNGLTNPTPLSEVVSRFFLLDDLLTTSEDAFWAKLIGVPETLNRRPQVSLPLLNVPCLSPGAYEQKALALLDRIRYTGGQVDLTALTRLLRDDLGVMVVHHGGFFQDDPGTYGRALFDPGEIHLYQTATAPLARRRFVWAHELAHFALGHGALLVSERFRLNGEAEKEQAIVSHQAIRAMEAQANRLAGALLMPKLWVLPEINGLLADLGVRNRGFDAIYLDAQACNRSIFMAVTGMMMEEYGASRTSAKIRFLQLGLLNEAQEAVSMKAAMRTFLASNLHVI